MPTRVERTDPDGVDFGWVMQVTFVTTIVVGAPVVAALSATTPLPTWESRVAFAVRVGAVVWFLTAIAVYGYARRTVDDESKTGATDDSEGAPEADHETASAEQ